MRVASTADLDALTELATALDAELAPMRGGAIWHARDSRDPAGDLANEFRLLLADPDAEVFIGTIDDVPIAFAVVEYEHLRDDTWLARVTELYVDPGAREVGVGESLGAAVVDASRARGCIGVDAIALPGNRAAKNFFERQGFTARLITMHKSLAP